MTYIIIIIIIIIMETSFYSTFFKNLIQQIITKFLGIFYNKIEPQDKFGQNASIYK